MWRRQTNYRRHLPLILLWRIGYRETLFYLKIISALCCCLHIGCGRSDLQPVPTTENINLSNAQSEDKKNLAGNTRNDLRCGSVNDRVDETKAFILRREQAFEQASAQSAQACRSDSITDCEFWTQRVTTISKQIRELRQELQQLQDRKLRDNCN